MLLFCFHQRKQVPNGYTIIPIQMPGREELHSIPYGTSCQDVAKDVLPQVLLQLKKMRTRLIVFSHIV